MIEQRDYTLIVDRSGSMAVRDVNGQSRWQAVQESTLALARKCEQLDPDGLTVYFFSSNFRRQENVTSARVADLFASQQPEGSTNLAGVLEHALGSYFERKQAGQARPETLLVVTDGAPDDEEAVSRVIIDATHRLERDEELAISFIQIGSDDGARAFLKRLDDGLVGDAKPGFFQKLFGSKKARFDICDTITFDEMEDRSLTDILTSAIKD